MTLLFNVSFAIAGFALGVVLDRLLNQNDWLLAACFVLIIGGLYGPELYRWCRGRKTQ